MVDSTSLSLVSLRRATKVRNTSLSPPRFQECGSHEPSGFRSHGPGRGGLRFFFVILFSYPQKGRFGWRWTCEITLLDDDCL